MKPSTLEWDDPPYSGTLAQEVRHPQFIGRYGRSLPRLRKVGSIVPAGQVTASTQVEVDAAQEFPEKGQSTRSGTA
jgi:hypothetical protein